ncbi:MAG: hypothetical protein IKJ99_00420 [Oscillospiraceae bacterium]|nr:hypothetical protein [Oscillospiraceae bacterium]
MALPLILAMTAAEMAAASTLSNQAAWMACHFSPYSLGITNIPKSLPAGSILILNDRVPCQDHSPDLAAHQLSETLTHLHCESLLLDFQRPPEAESEAMVSFLLEALPRPVTVSELYAEGRNCPVFLSPPALHVPLDEYLIPWQNREVWLEAALCQEDIDVTESGTTFAPQFPPDYLDGGFFDPKLCCNYKTEVSDHQVRFTLFDTSESLMEKMKKAQSLGVSRAVGLFQELYPLLKV